MSQIKIYALQQTIEQFRNQLSHAIHQALVDSLDYPVGKKFQRFISLATNDFIYPEDRSDNYLIIEISMFEGRSKEANKHLIQLIFTYIQQQCGISPHDVEITIFETPKVNWGIRGQNAEELKLDYQVNV
ncbi:tautomerase family protein [Acinetobacter vivianii]|uniref:tautomerase family protein n=1 Tax=Acinetobacter vivianii TaxID=1776742 RepID=UPI004042E185